MTTITKKQASLALVVVAFAAIMIAGTIAASSDNAYASHKRSHTHQSIVQKCKQHQHATVLTAGALSPITASGNNLAACLNLNLSGNAAANDESG